MKLTVKTTVIWLLLFSFQNLVTGKKNVLFIISDDMRPQLGAYRGASYPSDVDQNIYTPNLDELASKSLLLTRAYAQYAVCAPSRTSFLTSRRVNTTLINDLVTDFRSTGNNFRSLPQHFSDNGYRTFGMGKIFHGGLPVAYYNPDPLSWTEPYYDPPARATWQLMNVSWLAVSESDIETHGILPDEETANRAIQVLQQVAEDARTGDQPFFLAVGFYLPHLAFIFPERFLDLYPREDINLPSNPYVPENMPDIAWYGWGNPVTAPQFGELSMYADHRAMNFSSEIGNTYPDERVIDLRRAYYCSISYVDELVGKILKELEHLGLADNTVISFAGDHGFSLGENAEWSKVTNLEQSTHAPMMIHIPEVTERGIRSDALVELLDLYPTIVEAAGLEPVPLCPEDSRSIPVCTEGMSMMPLTRNHPGPWKDAAFSQIERIGGTGYSIRTDRYRYTEWPAWLNAEAGAIYGLVNPNNIFYQPDWSTLLGVELYDHDVDPLENINRADYPQYSDVIQELSMRLRQGWRAALPRLTCYSCKNAESHEECNTRTEQCGLNQLCMTEYEVDNLKGMFSVTKQCRQEQACGALADNVECAPDVDGKQRCWYCCDGHLCNDV